MKIKSKLDSRRVLTVSVVGLGTLLSSPSQSQEEETEDVYELSPFAVTAEENSGYQATSTLAGTRLKTELRDVGAAVSVMTEEFLEDTGATDGASVLSYALNMEVSGVQGNYAGGAVGSRTFDNAEERRELQNGQRVRGLSRASLTRGYFLTDIPFDGYNTGSITINRGPNSLLFGIGEPGGVIDNATKLASSSENFGQLSFRLGERGSHRATLDVNRSLIEGRLGVRIALLDEETKYQQRPAFETDSRVHMALDAVLFENEESSFLGRTHLRANAEAGSMEGTPPNIIPPTDGVSAWFELPDYSVSEVEAVNDGDLPGALYFMEDGSFVAKDILDTRYGASGFEFPNTNRSPYYFNFPVIYNDVKAQTSTVGLNDSSINGVIGRVQWNRLNPQIEPYTEQVTFQSLQPIEIDSMPGYTAPVFMDKTVLDNERLLLSGTSSFVDREFDVVNFALEQGLFEGRAGFEIAVDKQSYENTSSLRMDDDRNNFVWIDINQYFPDHTLNPNAGRAFMISFGGDNSTQTRKVDRESYRATAYYKLNLEDGDKWTKWLGNHTFTAVHSSQEFDTLSMTHAQNWVDVGGGNAQVQEIQSHKLNQGRRRMATIHYVTGSLLGSEYQSIQDVQFNDYIDNPTPRDGDVYRMIYSPNFGDPMLNPETGLPSFKGDFEVYSALAGGNHTLQTIDSDVLSWQGRFFGGNIVALLGYREDESETFSRKGNAVLATGEWDAANLELDYSNPSYDSGDTITKSIVGHIPEAWTAGLPFDISFHYNESENFSALPARYNVRREKIGSPKGAAKDYGFTFELLEKKLSVRFNWFEVGATNITASVPGASYIGGNYISQMLNRAFTNEDDGLTIDEYLTHPDQNIVDASGRFDSWGELYDEILNLPSAKSYGKQYYSDTSEAADSFGNLLNPITPMVATTGYVTEGVEIEMVGNLTKNWRVSLNVGKQETVESGTAKVMAEEAFKLRDEIANSKLADLKDSISRSEGNTFLQRFQRLYLNPLAVPLAKDGTVSQEQRKWRVNMVSSYRFEEGFAKGVTVGGALRWQDKAAVGYESLSVVAGAVTPDLDKPLFDSAQLNGDAWVAYEKSLNNRIDWKVQLNVRNLIGDRDYIPVLINPDGRTAVVRNSNPKEFYLTNSFAF